jgi:hypothetical protein
VTALEVGFLDSVAWRVDAQLHLALHLPEVAPVAADTPVEVRLRDADRRARVPGRIAPAASGSMIEAEVLARRLAGGLWRIDVRIGDADEFTRVEARLLVTRGQPVALLPGRAPRTRLPEPEPRRSPSRSASVRSMAGRVLRKVRSSR